MHQVQIPARAFSFLFGLDSAFDAAIADDAEKHADAAPSHRVAIYLEFQHFCERFSPRGAYAE